MIQIDDVNVPSPSAFQAERIVISSGEKRNAVGGMVVDFTAAKKRLVLEYRHLTGSDLKTLSDAAESGRFVSVLFPDPETGESATGQFWVSEFSTGMLRMNDGVPEWRDVRLTLVEA